MLLNNMYECDNCGKIHGDKRILLEIEVGKISQNWQESSFSNRTIHLCNINNKCVVGWAKTISQKEVR